MKSINKILMKAKLKNYIYIYRERERERETERQRDRETEREQEQVLDLNNQTPKCMVNTSFNRSKFETIDLMTNC